MLFKLRSETINVKKNFANAYLNNDMLCDLCHVLSGTLVVDKSVDLIEKFIYGTVEQQVVYVKIYKHFWDLREKILDKNTENDSEL